MRLRFLLHASQISKCTVKALSHEATFHATLQATEELHRVTASESVACNVAEVETDLTSATLHATLQKGVTRIRKLRATLHAIVAPCDRIFSSVLNSLLNCWE